MNLKSVLNKPTLKTKDINKEHQQKNADGKEHQEHQDQEQEELQKMQGEKKVQRQRRKSRMDGRMWEALKTVVSTCWFPLPYRTADRI